MVRHGPRWVAARMRASRCDGTASVVPVQAASIHLRCSDIASAGRGHYCPQPDRFESELRASAFRLLQRREVPSQFVRGRRFLDRVVIEVVGGLYPVIAQYVGSRQLLGKLADVKGGLQEEVPCLFRMPAPALALLPVAAEDFGQLPHRLDGDLLVLEDLAERWKGFKGNLCRGHRVVVTKLQP